MSGGKHTTRQDDDYLLRMLDLRMQHQAVTVAKMLGVKSERVRTMCNRVVVDDIKASKKQGVETPAQVLADYWGVGL
jgi:hypothetical protein